MSEYPAPRSKSEWACTNVGFYVFKGKKMAGQLGKVRATQQNLEIISTDVERGLILVKGSVPGSAGNYVFVNDAVKKTKREEEAPELERF